MLFLSSWVEPVHVLSNFAQRHNTVLFDSLRPSQQVFSYVTQHSKVGESRTSNPSTPSLTLYQLSQ